MRYLDFYKFRNILETELLSFTSVKAEINEWEGKLGKKLLTYTLNVHYKVNQANQSKARLTNKGKGVPKIIEERTNAKRVGDSWKAVEPLEGSRGREKILFRIRH